MIRRPPRSTLDRSSAASDVYKRQVPARVPEQPGDQARELQGAGKQIGDGLDVAYLLSVSYTHLRAHETVLDLVCRLLLEKKNTNYMKKDRALNDRKYQVTMRTQN